MPKYLHKIKCFGRYPVGSGFPLYLFKMLLPVQSIWKSTKLNASPKVVTNKILKRMPLQSLTRAYQPAIVKTLTFCVLVMVLASTSCTQKKRSIKGDTPFQKELNAFYKDASTSPLLKKDRKHFEGLDFFKFDSAYIITANFKRTPNEAPFEMKTTTDRKPMYIKYGEVTFTLHTKTFTLDVFENLDYKAEDDYEPFLFLPFLDETNGIETYGGGRYIEIKMPNNATVTIDFNRAYNPYCAYNAKYSCPIVPRQNYLKTRVEAGVKAFSKH